MENTLCLLNRKKGGNDHAAGIFIKNDQITKCLYLILFYFSCMLKYSVFFHCKEIKKNGLL